MKTRNTDNKKGRGFSLVEMLVVISVIGIIAAIAVPTIGNITGNADEAAAKRNAQTAASLYAGAIASGAEFDGEDKSAILTELAQGKAGVDVGGSKFKMAELSANEKEQALGYLSYNDETKTLSYVPGGGQASVAAAATPWGDWVPGGGLNAYPGGTGVGGLGGTFDDSGVPSFGTEAEAEAFAAELAEAFPGEEFMTEEYFDYGAEGGPEDGSWVVANVGYWDES